MINAEFFLNNEIYKPINLIIRVLLQFKKAVLFYYFRPIKYEVAKVLSFYVIYTYLSLCTVAADQPIIELSDLCSF